MRDFPGCGRTAGSRRRSARWDLVQLSDPEDLRAAVGARALNRRATVLHGHLLRILDLDLLLLLDAVALRHGATSWVGWTPSFPPPWDGFLPVCANCVNTSASCATRAGRNSRCARTRSCRNI